MSQGSFAASNKKPPSRLVVGRQSDTLPLSRQMLVDVVALADMSLIVGVALLIRYLYVVFCYDESDATLFTDWTSYFSMTVLVTSILYAALRWRGFYRYEDFVDWSPGRSTFRLIITVLFSFTSSLFIVFMLKQSDQFSRIWVVCWCLSSFVILYTSKMVWILQLRRLAKKGHFRRRILLVGSGQTLRNARNSILAAKTQVELVGVSDLDLSDEAKGRATSNVSIAICDALEKGQSNSIDEVIIAVPSTETSLLDLIIKGLRVLPIEVKVALDFGGVNHRPLELGHIGASSFVSVQRKPIKDWNVFLKATEDYILASLAFIAFLPAMVLIAFAIKLDSRGPIFFKQRRHGCNHKVIEVFKFRTMTVLEDGESVRQATKNDKRITRVGYFLRRTSLDELPQLINVLAGDMSLIGPRPHAIAHNDYYSGMLEDYSRRHRVKPGITGWAQVNGFRGETTEPELMAERVRYDLEYIDNWSIWFDLRILCLTPVYGFVSPRAY
jgi:putative colanic acid biosysnthesis UDP-glucose lipid carrier transferase